jgi:uncharacterized protein (TIGR01244 family)
MKTLFALGLLTAMIIPIACHGDPAGLGIQPAQMPEKLPGDEFNEILVQAADRLYIGGQPTERGFRDMAADGVTLVVNLRTDYEMDNRDIVPFDEAALLKSLGVRYVHIPSGGPDTPYTPAMVDEFARAVAEAEGKVLMHCTVAWRASHLYTAYLYRHAGLTLNEAVNHGRQINLGDFPLEAFLGGTLSVAVSDE